MQPTIAEYLTIRRSRDREISSPYLSMNNDGEVLYKYAINGDFSIIEQMCRDFVKELYEDNNGPEVLRLYDTGVNFVVYHLIRAWNIWHERTGNVNHSLSVMMFDKKNSKWIENIWYTNRL